MQTLDKLFTSIGDRFYNDLLNSEVTIYEKLDGNNFGVKVNGEGEFEFYRKNYNSPIGTVDRTLTTMYEEPISYIYNLPEDVKEAMPVGYKFGFFYFPTSMPNTIGYDKLPKNKLILNYVEDDAGNKISNIQTLDYFANILGVDGAPIYFKGKLTGEQKNQILEYLSLPLKKRKKSFIQTILKIINPNIKSTYLNNDIDKTIDSLIFKFDNGKEVNYAKLQDPSFKNILQERQEDSKATDNYYLILSDILDYFKLVNLDKIGLQKKKFEGRYIEIISKLFNLFISKKGEDYLHMDFELPEYLKKEYNNLNIINVENSQTIEYLESSMNYRELFRIMLSSFRKKRHRENNIFNSFMNSHFNDMVQKIIQKCSFDENVSESFITFNEFQKIFIDNEDSKDVIGVDLDVYNREHSQKIVGYREPDFDVKSFMKNMFVQVEDSNYVAKERELINVFIDDFAPMTNDQLLKIRETYENTGIPFFMVIVRTKKIGFPDSTIKKIFDALRMEESIVDYIIVDKPIVSQITKLFQDEYRMNKIYSSEEFEILLDVQVKTNELNNNILNFKDPKDVIEYYIKDKSVVSALERYIEDNNFAKYREFVPEIYSHMFTEIIANLDFNK